MSWAVLATWKMSYDGCKITADLLKNGSDSAAACIKGIQNVEDNPNSHSVGYGGRPNRDGRVFLDGGFMDGNTLHFGAVASIEGFCSPVEIAHSLMEPDANNFLVGTGAEQYAREKGFAQRDNVTPEAYALYEKEKEHRKQLSAYDGHDTVCFLANDVYHKCVAATSTSGLFMKEPGRVGDTPCPGSGFYADSKVGSAAATGMGEEIMKGSLSFLAVFYMKQGMSAQEAADRAVDDLNRELIERNGYAQAMSLIVLDKDGHYGVGTNVEFTFTYASDTQKPVLMLAKPSAAGAVIAEVESI